MDKIKKGKEKQMENKKLFNKNVDDIEKELETNINNGLTTDKK